MLIHTAPSTIAASMIGSSQGAMSMYNETRPIWPRRSLGSTNILLARHLADLLEQTGCDVDHLVVDDAILGDGFLQRDGDNLVCFQGRHAAKFAAMHHVDCSQAISCCQHTVECR